MSSDSVSEKPIPGSSLGLLISLSVMMFLQYFVQGSYLPIVSLYLKDALNFTGTQIGAFGAAIAVGPILLPFLIGQIVDRHFPTERVMAFCHILAGLLMLWLYVARSVWPILILGTFYSILYVPTMMLSNSLAMQHLKNKDLEFPWVRLFGTVGFIVPAFLIEMFFLKNMEQADLAIGRGVAFALAGSIGIVMGVYCMFLPHTPPLKQESRSYAPGVVAGMLRFRHFAVLVITSFFIAIVHKFYFVWNSPFLKDILLTAQTYEAREQRISSIGQICELAVMAGLGFCIKRFGYKVTLLTGATAYALRCFLFSSVFSLDPPFATKLAIACVGQALHGLCFGCFLATAYLFVDRISPSHVRGSMQTFYGTSVIALGFFAGGFVAGGVGDYYSEVIDGHTVHNWTQIWFSCGLLASACVMGFLLFFPKGPYEAPSQDKAEPENQGSAADNDHE